MTERLQKAIEALLNSYATGELALAYDDGDGTYVDDLFYELEEAYDEEAEG